MIIEVAQGQAVNVDHIVTVISMSKGNKTRIVMSNGDPIDVNIPYDQFYGVIKSGKNSMEAKLEQISKQIRTPVP